MGAQQEDNRSTDTAAATSDATFNNNSNWNWWFPSITGDSEKGVEQDIEMSTVNPLPQHSSSNIEKPSHVNVSQIDPHDNAYKSIMTDIPFSASGGSTLDGTNCPNSPGQYCVVCLSRPVDSVIQDCGHATCCLSCLMSIAAKASVSQRQLSSNAHMHTMLGNHQKQPTAIGNCPMCRIGITNILQLKDKPFVVNDEKTAAISNIQYQVKYRQDGEDFDDYEADDHNADDIHHQNKYLNPNLSLLDVSI